ncbi:MAG: PQQ-binding-like beta-propeller repeat protein [Verrucomicrobia bacterium]|nr:MAG: PQQ-binding-like beta-propeller repeat protein [Verrucomicrobiota bacterium]
MTNPVQKQNHSIRWWPGVLLFIAMLSAVIWVHLQPEWPFQKRNLFSAQIGGISGILLLGWWTFLSRAPNRLRLSVTFGLVGLVVLCATLFRVRGVSGDLLPIVELRWTKRALPEASTCYQSSISPALNPLKDSTNSFPQFLGPDRNGVLAGPKLETNWLAHPPEILWRQSVGAGWSGFVIIGDACITHEQCGPDECVTAYKLRTGKPIWAHTNQGRYDTVIAGEGPRATPTVASNHVFTCGGTGILNCLDLVSGKLIWTRDVIADSGGKIPQWGYTSSPLVVDGLVIVHGGEGVQRSVFAYRIEDGTLLWTAGTNPPSYASLTLATLAEMQQVLAFNHGSVSAHDPATGATLWEKPWGNRNVVCASPVVVGTNRVLFSSGYGVGAELIEVTRVSSHRLSAKRVWKSIRMKSKFAHMFARDGNLYGLDDGIFACLNLADGSQRWKEGRYGHGQGLLVGGNYLLMAESGELVLLRPMPESPNELSRFRVFNSKTWNPIVLSGDLLLARNDREAVCLRLKISP